MERVQGQDRYFDNKGLSLHYVEWGDTAARPLVLLHGIASFAHIWDFIAPSLAAEYRVLALDWRGHGDSAWAGPGGYGYHDYMSDLSQLISFLDLREVAVVGHSLGGLVALYYASQSPERLRAVVAADFRTNATAEELEQGRQQSLRPQREFATAEEIVDRFGSSLAPTAAIGEALRHLGRCAIKQTDSGRWIFKFDRAALAIAPIDPWDALSNVRVPALALRGEGSPLMTSVALAAVGETVPGIRVIEVPDAYHHLFLDKPEEFTREVQTFLHSPGS